MPIAVAHGEGRAEFADVTAVRECLRDSGLVSLRFVDNHGRPTEALSREPERLARAASPASRAATAARRS